MSDEPRTSKDLYRAANEGEYGLRSGCFRDQDSDPVMTLARLLGRQIAREEFERALAASNDNAPRQDTNEG